MPIQLLYGVLLSLLFTTLYQKSKTQGHFLNSPRNKVACISQRSKALKVVSMLVCEFLKKDQINESLKL